MQLYIRCQWKFWWKNFVCELFVTHFLHVNLWACLAIICVLEKEWVELITEGDLSFPSNHFTWGWNLAFQKISVGRSCALFAQLAKVEPWNCLTQIILCLININFPKTGFAIWGPISYLSSIDKNYFTNENFFFSTNVQVFLSSHCRTHIILGQ